jgi:hypothetical protein
MIPRQSRGSRVSTSLYARQPVGSMWEAPRIYICGGAPIGPRCVGESTETNTCSARGADTARQTLSSRSELVRPSWLLATEQSWLDKTNSIDPNIGFNILPRALSSASVAVQARKGFFDPSGRPVTIKNLHEFCRENRLNFTAMLQLYHGRSKLKSHKGWTHKNSVRIRDYIKTHTGFINPYGKPIGKITNLHEFSRRRGLTASHMIAVAHDRIRSHRGWTHLHGRERLTPKIFSRFIRPDGRRTVIINLSRLCRENGLSVVHMHNLKSGIRRIHKGWTWNPE